MLGAAGAAGVAPTRRRDMYHLDGQRSKALNNTAHLFELVKYFPPFLFLCIYFFSLVLKLKALKTAVSDLGLAVFSRGN